MVHKKLLVGLAFLVYSSYSYCEQVYGSSSNATANGLNWVMSNVLPQQAGLTVNGVVYRYTTIKNAEDDMIVHVQNEDAINGGYVFRSSDDWSGLPGNTINKLVPTPNIPLQQWGNGSIEVEGKGEVTNTTVIYNYNYDTCFEVTTDPRCPGYIPEITLVSYGAEDPLDNEFIKKEIEKKAEISDEDEKDKNRKEVTKEKLQKQRLEKLLGITITGALEKEAQARHDVLVSINYIPDSYYISIPDTKYEETIVLKDSKISDNRKARRQNVAQQLLHEQMVNLQYTKEEEEK